MARFPDTPKTKQLKPDEIAAKLKVLFDESVVGADFIRYRSFFYLYCVTEDDFLKIVADAEVKEPNTIDWPLFDQYKDLSIPVQTISDLVNSNVFAHNSSPFRTFVTLAEFFGPGQDVPLPFHTVRVLSGSFIKGLITRLILQMYPLKLKGDLVLRTAFSFGTPSGTPWKADDWASEYLSKFSAHLQSATSWNEARDDKKNPDYERCLSALTDSTLQMAGIVLGWEAGDALSAMPADPGDKIRTAIWSLLNSQFTTQQLGMAVAYTLSFIAGYIATERNINVVEGKPADRALPDPTNIGAVHNKLGEHIRCGNHRHNAAFDIANRFFALVVAESYIVANDEHYEDDTKEDQGEASRAYQAFIIGFERGLASGAEEIFDELFKDGYSLGYSAGWQDGYRAGYKANSNQPTWLGSLQSIIGDVHGALGDLTTLVSDAKTAATVIAVIFD
jgi:hypothetical protein